MSFVGSNILAGASGQGGGGGGSGYQIERSLRFNAADTAFLERDLTSVGDQRVMTFSFWVKKNNTSSSGELMIAGQDYDTSGSAVTARSLSFYFHNNNLKIYDYGASNAAGNGGSSTPWYPGALGTDVLFRDPSAWQSIICAIDTTQSTAANRCKFWVNGVPYTHSSPPTQNSYLSWGQVRKHYIGIQKVNGGFTRAGDFQLANFHFIDGQQLAATDFGEFDVNNVWQPKEFEGNYVTTYSHTSTLLSQTGWNPAHSGNIWDGNASSASRATGYAGGTKGTVSFTPPLTNVIKVEIWTQNYVNYLNGVSVSTPENTNGGWHTLYDNSGSPITLNSVGNAYDTNNTQTVDLAGIRINGSIVNSQTWTPPSGVGFGATASNSFYLDFADNSSNAALGTDTSGNGNNWTVNNLLAQATVSANINWDSGWNPSTPNGGVDKASISGNVATSISSRWSMASSSASLATNAITTSGFLSSNGGNTWFGLGKKLTGSYNETLRDSTISYGIYWGWNNGTNTPGGHGTSISGITFGTSNVIKLEVDPANSTLKVYKDGSLQQTVTLSSSFVTEITNGNIYWQSDQYNTGTVTLTNGLDNAFTDSLVDTPTNGTASTGGDAGGVTVGNYATWNPLTGNTTLSNGNLDSTGKSGHNQCLSTIGMSSGKYYCEITIDNADGGTAVGIGTKAEDGSFLGNTASGHLYYTNGTKRHTGVNVSYGASYTTGDIIGIAFDADGGNLYFYKNGTIQASGTAAFTGLTSGPYFFAVDQYNTTNKIVANLGQRTFSSAAPSGYKSLNTANLPTPTIADGSKYFDTKLYTGNGSTQALTMSNSSLSPDFVWIKSRNATYDHAVFDTVRGPLKRLRSNQTTVEGTDSTTLTSFDTNGFTTGSDDVTNKNSGSYVSWNWDAGSYNTTIAAGSISSGVPSRASTVRANPTAGFSIVSFTANGTAGTTIAHGLNAVPEFIVVKDREYAQNWQAYHGSLGGTKMFNWNTDESVYTDAGGFNNTNPNSNVFTLGNYSGYFGTNEMIAYCFTSISGYSKISSYTGNGSADGPFIYTGFRPAWIITKEITEAYPWQIQDTTRAPKNDAKEILYSSENWAEASANANMDILSNGFKPRRGSGYYNKNGGTIIYVAFAENPFKTARAR